MADYVFKLIVWTMEEGMADISLRKNENAGRGVTGHSGGSVWNSELCFRAIARRSPWLLPFLAAPAGREFPA